MPHELPAVRDAVGAGRGTSRVHHRGGRGRKVASVLTEDLDIVHRRTPENIERLMSVIEQLDAHFRHDLAGRKLRPRPSDLAGQGHVLLQTPHGHMDVLCEISGHRGYDELLPHSIVIADRGLSLQVLDLPTLIQVKIEVGRPKDKAAVPILIAALEAQKKPPS